MKPNFTTIENNEAIPERNFSFSEVIPLLRIFDVNKAIDFYVNWLGFQIDWHHKFDENFPVYMQISLKGMLLHLTEHHGDCTPGAKVFIQTRNIEAFFEHIQNCNYKYMKPSLEISTWNSSVIELTDPFNNKLLFSEPRVEKK